MENPSDKYLKEALFQAKKFGLDPIVIKQLESELEWRLQRNKALK